MNNIKVSLYEIAKEKVEKKYNQEPGIELTEAAKNLVQLIWCCSARTKKNDL